MELMVRLAATWVFEKYGYGERLSDHLDDFFAIYVQPTYEKTTMFEHRSKIRGNNYLNKLLYDNNNGLRSIYEIYKNEENCFTMDSAIEVFTGLEH